ncbi:PREDICTED: uncharacterized protein LOC106743212 [Dinoponera quadriceps]|uniref:Uncharacterized protein LOC106743212 n=1 Tax=Dinoponera quadriceps TaxID=609295 RepID=A0A6P3X284_DINQU|nr:PREDICTED: uncharacterized protein LOC106743212 [Dinoponera quadriceps]
MGDLTFLSPPKVNKEILPNLGPVVIARDKHQIDAQAQVRAVLNVLGKKSSGISELSKLECFQASAEDKSTAIKIAEGIRLLADHHFRLSQTRRAFIVPSLNFLDKTAFDSASIDDCLFGSNFAEEINAAQSVEKVARKMIRKVHQPPVQQARHPITQQLKQQNNVFW